MIRATVALVLATLLVPATRAAAQPLRDSPRDVPRGTASVSGTVFTDEAQPRPLRRARVILTGNRLPLGRAVIADDNGTFAFDRLPAGRYSIGAAKEGYVSMNHGATRTGRPGTPFDLRDGATHRVSLRLPRGGVITGTVTSADGLPLPGTRVVASIERYAPAIGERRLQPAAAVSIPTDDRGVYRIYGLPPGDYVVIALAQVSHMPAGELHVVTDTEVRRALAEVKAPGRAARPEGAAESPARASTYASVFYPGTPVASQAALVTIGKGEERSGVDIQISLVPTARVDGIVVSPRPEIRVISVGLMPSQAPRTAPDAFRAQRRVDSDGRFSISGVPPGQYTVRAQAMLPTTTPGAWPGMMWATTEIAVHGEDVGNVALTLSRGITVSGRIVFAGALPPPVDFSKLRVNVPLTLAGTMSIPVPPLQVDASGRFVLEGILPGSYRIGTNAQGLRTPIGQWWLESVVINGREALDSPLELREDAVDAVVTFAARASALSGEVRDERGVAAPDAWVVAFSTERSSWFHNSRRIAAVRSGPDARYTIRNLPPGEYHLAVTFDLENGEWFDPVTLQQLASHAMRIAIGQYEQKTADLTYISR